MDLVRHFTVDLQGFQSDEGMTNALAKTSLLAPRIDIAVEGKAAFDASW